VADEAEPEEAVDETSGSDEVAAIEDPEESDGE